MFKRNNNELIVHLNYWSNNLPVHYTKCENFGLEYIRSSNIEEQDLYCTTIIDEQIFDNYTVNLHYKIIDKSKWLLTVLKYSLIVA